jgi:hypothetical protein
MDPNLTIQDHKNFTESILKEIQKLPFGSLPKTELEMIILHSIICSIEPNDPYSNIYKKYNELKNILKLSQVQLKNKILAAQLRFDSINDKEVENHIIKSLLKGEYSVEGSNYIITIFNPLLNEQAKSYFEIRKIISDTSFNKTILKINLNGFVKFIYQLNDITDEKKVEIQKILKEVQYQGMISISNKDSKKSLLEKIESITVIGNNLINIIEKFSPFLNSNLS